MFQKLVYQWRNVFYLSGALNVAAFLFFAVLGDARIQPWAIKYMETGTDDQELHAVAGKDENQHNSVELNGYSDISNAK